MPFAVIRGDFKGNPGPNSRARSFKRHAERHELAPDLVVMHPRETRFNMAHTVLGVFAAPVAVQPQVDGVCLRLAPASTGVTFNASLMVTDVDDRTRASGILEGDTLVSVNGQPFEVPPAEPLSPAAVELLNLDVGDEYTLTWIRPGTGRMEGRGVALEPAAMPSFQTLAIERKKRRRSRS